MSEVLEVKATELDLIVTDSKLELNEGEQIKQSYLPFFEQLAEIKEQTKKINFETPTLLDEKIARELRLKLVKVRTGSEEVKDNRKRIHMLKADVEQKAWNLIKSTCQLDEEILTQVEKKREIEEKKRKEQLKVERTESLSKYCDNANIYPLGDLDEAAFENLLNGQKLAYEAKIEAERKAEEERIENIRLDKLANERRIEIAPYVQFITESQDLRLMSEDDYNHYLSLLQQAKIDYEAEQTKIKAEKERLENELRIQRAKAEKEKQEAEEKARKERQELEAKAKAEADRLEKIRLEEKRKQDEVLAKERAEREKVEAELRAKAEKEKQELARLEAEKAEREKAEKAKLLAPDKNKLIELANTFKSIKLPDLKTKEAAKILENISILQGKLVTYITDQSSTL